MHQILLNWSHLGSSIAERSQLECYYCNPEALCSIPWQPLARFVLGSPKFNSLVMPVNSQLVCLWPVRILNHDCFVYFSYLFLPFSICWVTIYNVNCWVTSNIIVLPLQSHLFSFNILHLLISCCVLLLSGVDVS